MSHKIVINNSDSAPREFWLEPWGDGLEVPPGHSAIIEFCGPTEMDLRFESQPGRLILWVESGEPCRDVSRLFDVVADRPAPAGLGKPPPG